MFRLGADELARRERETYASSCSSGGLPSCRPVSRFRTCPPGGPLDGPRAVPATPPGETGCSLPPNYRLVCERPNKGNKAIEREVIASYQIAQSLGFKGDFTNKFKSPPSRNRDLPPEKAPACVNRPGPRFLLFASKGNRLGNRHPCK